MRVMILNRDNRPWRAPRNHMDRRVCPSCGVTCHGRDGQAKHQGRHREEAAYRARVNDLLEELAKRTGLTEELVKLSGDEWSWGSEVEGSAEDD